MVTCRMNRATTSRLLTRTAWETEKYTVVDGISYLLFPDGALLCYREFFSSVDLV